MLPVIVIGAGNVLRRYIAGIDATRESAGFVITDVVDIVPVDALRERCAAAGCEPGVALHRIDPNRLRSLSQVLARLDRSGLVIVASPSPSHVSQAIVALDQGRTVAVEKPYAVRPAGMERFDRRVRRVGGERLFLFGYYALEKGLPLLLLAREGKVPGSYLDAVTPSLSGEDWAEMRRGLGSLRSISGCILEGHGRKGSLADRQWVLAPGSGGLTLEQFYHLVCLALPFGSPADFRIRDVHLLVDGTAARAYREATGGPAAETFVAADLRIGGAPVRLVAAKYVHPMLQGRWMRLVFEHGTATMDLEAMALVVESRRRRSHVKVLNPAPYATQLQLLASHLRQPAMQPELTLFGSALRLSLRIREVGVSKGIAPVDTPTITPHWVGQFLAGDRVDSPLGGPSAEGGDVDATRAGGAAVEP